MNKDVRSKIIDVVADMYYTKEHDPEKFKEIMDRVATYTNVRVKHHPNPKIKEVANQEHDLVDTLLSAVMSIIRDNPEKLIDWYDAGLVDEEMLKGL